MKNGAKMKKTGSRKSVKRKWRLFSVMRGEERFREEGETANKHREERERKQKK